MPALGAPGHLRRFVCCARVPAAWHSSGNGRCCAGQARTGPGSPGTSGQHHPSFLPNRARSATLWYVSDPAVGAFVAAGLSRPTVPVRAVLAHPWAQSRGLLRPVGSLLHDPPGHARLAEGCRVADYRGDAGSLPGSGRAAPARPAAGDLAECVNPALLNFQISSGCLGLGC